MLNDLAVQMLPEETVSVMYAIEAEGMRAPFGRIMVAAQTKGEHLFKHWKG